MMAVAIVVACLVLVGAVVWASGRMKHPENISDRDHGAGFSESDELHKGSDRPAGPDAEDPPTAVPNRTDPEPPSGPAAS